MTKQDGAPEQITDEQRARRIARLRELSYAITRPTDPWESRSDRMRREFSMRIPAEPDRDADLVLSWAADELERGADAMLRAREER